MVGCLATREPDEGKDPKYDLSVKPGTVTYGTHSTATTPILSASTHHSLPMVSGGAVRSYAYYGHSSASAGASGKGLYTTSSATVHTVGSGGGGGGAAGGGSSTSSSSSGVQYGGGFTAVSIPSLAFTPSKNNTTTTLMTTTAATSEMAAISRRMSTGPRRVNPHAGDVGTGGEKYQDTENPSIWWYWDEDEEDWVSGDPPVGTVKEEGGVYYEWDGSTWVRKDQVTDLGTPIGDAPWWLLVWLLAVYGIVIRRKHA